MKPAIFPAVVLAATLSVAAGSSLPISSSKPAAPCLATSGENAGSALSGEDRAALRAVELRDADLSDVKAGFAMADHDVMLVLGTIAVVVLIALLL